MLTILSIMYIFVTNNKLCSLTSSIIMKKSRKGKKKKRYAAIYNKQVYGHLKSGVWKFLMAALPKQMIRTMEDTIESK